LLVKKSINLLFEGIIIKPVIKAIVNGAYKITSAFTGLIFFGILGMAAGALFGMIAGSVLDGSIIWGNTFGMAIFEGVGKYFTVDIASEQSIVASFFDIINGLLAGSMVGAIDGMVAGIVLGVLQPKQFNRSLHKILLAIIERDTALIQKKLAEITKKESDSIASNNSDSSVSNKNIVEKASKKTIDHIGQKKADEVEEMISDEIASRVMVEDTDIGEQTAKTEEHTGEDAAETMRETGKELAKNIGNSVIDGTSVAADAITSASQKVGGRLGNAASAAGNKAKNIFK